MKILIKISSLTLLLFIVNINAISQDITGDWHALLEMHNVKLRCVEHITKEGSGYKLISDSPDENFYGDVYDTVFFSNNQLIYKIEKFDIYYKGTLSKQGTFIEGMFYQHGDSVILTYGRAPLMAPDEKYIRPSYNEPFYQKYVGKYKLEDGQLIQIDYANDKLLLKFSTGEEFEIQPNTDTDFTFVGNKDFKWATFIFKDDRVSSVTLDKIVGVIGTKL